MDEVKREPEKAAAEGTVQSPSPRHRKWWQTIGNGAMVLLAFLGCGLMIDLVNGWNTGSQPLNETIQSAILRISVAWMAGGFLAHWGMLLKSYCFARAATTERIKLFDHPRTASVWQRIIKQVYIDARVLAVLLCLYLVSYLCFLIRSLF